MLQTIKYKSPFLTGVLTLAAALYAGGFIVQAISAHHYDSIGLFIASSVCLILAPPIYASCLYLVLGRAMYYVPYLAPLHPGRVITTFVGLDVICGVILGQGVSKVSSPKGSEQKVGKYLLDIGMCLQCFLIFFFIGLTAIFHNRCRRGSLDMRFHSIWTALYICASMNLARTVYRTVEFFQGLVLAISPRSNIAYVF